jgi:hypothetical protein
VRGSIFQEMHKYRFGFFLKFYCFPSDVLANLPMIVSGSPRMPQ